MDAVTLGPETTASFGWDLDASRLGAASSPDDPLQQNACRPNRRDQEADPLKRQAGASGGDQQTAQQRGGDEDRARQRIENAHHTPNRFFGRFLLPQVIVRGVSERPLDQRGNGAGQVVKAVLGRQFLPERAVFVLPFRVPAEGVQKKEHEANSAAPPPFPCRGTVPAGGWFRRRGKPCTRPVGIAEASAHRSWLIPYFLILLYSVPREMPSRSAAAFLFP